ncbi:Protein ssh4 [Entomophthora muscae]|uniref:Protein ssh4 n=1 Tax=Entomophthora muscae TaxID=34485 RepID=A0ACC2UP60_9FUNG|nr:Protein ssh4 [Entomophthora muscae]
MSGGLGSANTSNSGSKGDTEKLTQNIVICLSIALGLLLILFLIIQLTRKFGMDRAKGEDVPRHWQRSSIDSFGSSPCEFKARAGSLVAVRNKSELAFPDLSATSIQTIEPIPTQQPSCYFEVEIISCPERSNICIGLAPGNLSPLLTPGHADNSIGYGSLDGQLYCSSVLLRFLPELRYSSRDTVGCGFFPRAQMVLFTKNGERVAYIPFSLLSGDVELYPTVASIGTSIVRVNFGQRRFTYREANQNAWGFGVYSGMEIYDLPAPPPAYGTPPDSDSNPQITIVPNASLARRSSFTPQP